MVHFKSSVGEYTHCTDSTRLMAFLWLVIPFWSNMVSFYYRISVFFISDSILAKLYDHLQSDPICSPTQGRLWTPGHPFSFAPVHGIVITSWNYMVRMFGESANLFQDKPLIRDKSKDQQRLNIKSRSSFFCFWPPAVAFFSIGGLSGDPPDVQTIGMTDGLFIFLIF